MFKLIQPPRELGIKCFITIAATTMGSKEEQGIEYFMTIATTTIGS